MSLNKLKVSHYRSKSKSDDTNAAISPISKQSDNICNDRVDINCNSDSITYNSLTKFRKSYNKYKKFSIKIVLNKFLISYLTISLAFNPVIQCYASSSGPLPPSSSTHSDQSASDHSPEHYYRNSHKAHPAGNNYHNSQREAELKAVASVAASVNEQFRIPQMNPGPTSQDANSDSDEYEDEYDDDDEQPEKNNQIDPMFYSMLKHSSQNFVNHDFRIKNTTDFNLNEEDMSASMENSPSYKCPACRMREELKEASLLSIKNHILQKLSMYNRTKAAQYPTVPAQIIDEFCKHNECVGSHCECTSKKSGHKLSSYDFKDDEMQGDDPEAGSQQQVSDEMDGGREVIEDEDDDYYPVPNSIYAFPSK